EPEGFDPSYAVDFWDITNRQDWSACEAVQRGVSSSGYRPGPLSSWEGTVYQFLAWIANLYLGNGVVVPVAPERHRVGSDPAHSRRVPSPRRAMIQTSPFHPRTSE